MHPDLVPPNGNAELTGQHRRSSRRCHWALHRVYVRLRSSIHLWLEPDVLTRPFKPLSGPPEASRQLPGKVRSGMLDRRYGSGVVDLVRLLEKRRKGVQLVRLCEAIERVVRSRSGVSRDAQHRYWRHGTFGSTLSDPLRGHLAQTFSVVNDPGYLRSEISPKEVARRCAMYPRCTKRY